MRCLFKPSGRAMIGLCPGRHNITRPGYDIVAGNECDLLPDDAARLCDAYEGEDGRPCLLPQDDIADSESPPPIVESEIVSDDGPEAVAPLDHPVPLAEAFAPPSVSEAEPVVLAEAPPAPKPAAPAPDPQPAKGPKGLRR